MLSRGWAPMRVWLSFSRTTTSSADSSGSFHSVSPPQTTPSASFGTGASFRASFFFVAGFFSGFDGSRRATGWRGAGALSGDRVSRLVAGASVLSAL